MSEKLHQFELSSISLDSFFFLLASQLNGTTVGEVHIKVSIARKQPMLDAATGKSVWASLGKLTVQFSVFLVSSLVLSFRTQLVITFTLSFFHSCAEQLKRLLQGQEEPGCVQ